MMYGPPHGCVFSSRGRDAQAVVSACGRFRDDTCEMKRLYVRPAFRGQDAGRQLAVEAAPGPGARLPHDGSSTRWNRCTRRMAWYLSMGFTPAQAYYDNPLPDEHLALDPRRAGDRREGPTFCSRQRVSEYPLPLCRTSSLPGSSEGPNRRAANRSSVAITKGRFPGSTALNLFLSNRGLNENVMTWSGHGHLPAG